MSKWENLFSLQNVESESENPESPPTVEPQPIDVVSVKHFRRNQVRSALANKNSSTEHEFRLFDFGGYLRFR
jgi:hypothetical protein